MPVPLRIDTWQLLPVPVPIWCDVSNGFICIRWSRIRCIAICNEICDWSDIFWIDLSWVIADCLWLHKTFCWKSWRNKTLNVSLWETFVEAVAGVPLSSWHFTTLRLKTFWNVCRSCRRRPTHLLPTRLSWYYCTTLRSRFKEQTFCPPFSQTGEMTCHGFRTN